MTKTRYCKGFGKALVYKLYLRKRHAPFQKGQRLYVFRVILRGTILNKIFTKNENVIIETYVFQMIIDN